MKLIVYNILFYYSDYQNHIFESRFFVLNLILL